MIACGKGSGEKTFPVCLVCAFCAYSTHILYNKQKEDL